MIKAFSARDIGITKDPGITGPKRGNLHDFMDVIVHTAGNIIKLPEAGISKNHQKRLSKFLLQFFLIFEREIRKSVGSDPLLDDERNHKPVSDKT